MPSVKENLVAALRHIFLPLCRIAIRNGIRWNDISTALRDALVRAANAELRAAGIPDASDEEVAQKAGVVVGQVREAKRSDVDGTGVRDFSFSAQEVLAGWHSDRSYSGPYGLVLDVPFESGASGHGTRSFEALVKKYAGPDASPRVVLEELLKTKNVEHMGDGILRSTTRTYIPGRLSPENIQRFATVVHNLIGTTAVNMQREVPGTGLMERIVWADFGLNPDDLQKFNSYIRLRGQAFADEVDTWFQEHSNSERRGSTRTGIGLFHYVENDEDREAYLKSMDVKGDRNAE